MVSRSKSWYPLVDFYGRLVPVIVFIAAPLIFAIIIVTTAPDEVYEIRNEFEVDEYADESTDSSGFFEALGYSLIGYIVLELGYGIMPVKFTNEKHFIKRGYKRISIEFQTLKIVFVGLLPLSLIVSYVNFLNLTGLGFVLENYFDNIILIATVGAGLRILTHFMHKEYRYYLAKGYCITVTQKEDDFEKANYLSATLDSYNKYLRRRTQIEIKDIKRIYATFLAADMKEKNQIIKSVVRKR